MRFLGLKKWASHFGKRDSLFFKILKIGLVPFSFLIKRFLISGLRVVDLLRFYAQPIRRGGGAWRMARIARKFVKWTYPLNQFF